MTDSDENCRNVCFEDKVLNQYGTFDYLHSSNAKKKTNSSIYIDATNNFVCAHFTNKAFF